MQLLPAGPERRTRPRTRTCPAPIPVGCVAVVSFQTTYRPFTPIIATIVFPTGVTMTARSVLPVEFSCPTGSIPAAQCPKQP